jgi:hypothetical protein
MTKLINSDLSAAAQRNSGVATAEVELAFRKKGDLSDVVVGRSVSAQFGKPGPRGKSSFFVIDENGRKQNMTFKTFTETLEDVGINPSLLENFITNQVCFGGCAIQNLYHNLALPPLAPCCHNSQRQCTP